MGLALALILTTSLPCLAAPAAPAAHTEHAEHASSLQAGKSKPEVAKAPPLKPIASLSGFESSSTLTYAHNPGQPYRLKCTYVFPERVRWWLGSHDEKTTSQIHYRYGEHAYRIDGQSASVEETGRERDDAFRQMELRRALMLWPDGFAWKGSGLERKADLGALGSLHARFAKAGEKRPIEVSDRDRDGKEIDTYKALTWREEHGRQWPETAELWHDGKLAWSEKLDKLVPSAQYIELYFTPADRRPSKAPGSEQPGGKFEYSDPREARREPAESR